ncbi:MAG: DNA repair protein RecO [Vicinamibacterales bacterium]
MPLYTAEALVLRTYKFGEADRIVVFLTKDRGKKRGVARAARRQRSRFQAGLEPLTRVEVAYFEREQRDLVGLNYAEALRSPLVGGDGSALAYVGYFAELLDESVPEGDPSERLFRLGASIVDAIAVGVPVRPLARYFEYWLLKLQGVYPSHQRCSCCGGLFDDGAAGAWLLAGEREFRCEGCACAGGPRGIALSPGALAFLEQAARVSPERIGNVSYSDRLGRELQSAHRALIAAHLEKELRSIRVLRDMGEY